MVPNRDARGGRDRQKPYDPSAKDFPASPRQGQSTSDSVQGTYCNVGPCSYLGAQQHVDVLEW